MIALTYKLTDTVERDGYRSDAYNAVLDEIHESGARFDRGRRRRHVLWILLLLICYVAPVVLAIVLLWSSYN